MLIINLIINIIYLLIIVGKINIECDKIIRKVLLLIRIKIKISHYIKYKKFKILFLLILIKLTFFIKLRPLLL